MSALVLSHTVPILFEAPPGPSATVWCQITVPGEYRGHHQGGEFTIDHAACQQIIKNFLNTRNRHIPVDFEHMGEQSSGEVAVSGAPAAGWCTELAERRPGELWGKITWLEPALSYIREGRYRYLSPAITFEGIDRVTAKPIGAVMSSVGLVNMPFLDGAQPLAAKASTNDPCLLMAREILASQRKVTTIMHTHLNVHERATQIMREKRVTFGAALTQASREAKQYSMRESGIRQYDGHTYRLDDREVGRSDPSAHSRASNANTQAADWGREDVPTRDNTLFSALCRRVQCSDHELAAKLAAVLDNYERMGGRY